jgi:hypothetical protein
VARRSAVGMAAPAAMGLTSELETVFGSLARINAARSEIVASAAMTSATEMTLTAESLRPVAADVDIQVIVSDSSGASGASVGSSRGRIPAGARAVVVTTAVPLGSRGPWQVVMRLSGSDVRGGDALQVNAVSAPLTEAYVQRIDSTGAAPVAIPSFARRERLRATWSTVAATDSAALPTFIARVLDRHGEPLPIDAVVTTTPIGARVSAAVDVTLAPLAPGDYALELAATINGTTFRRFVGFRVTQ